MDPKDIGFPDREADTIADGLRREDVEAAKLSAEHSTPTIMAELGDDASIVGAAAWARQSTLEGSSP